MSKIVLKKLLTSLFVLALVITSMTSLSIAEEKSEKKWSLLSPCGNVSVSIMMNDDGSLDYNATKNGKNIVSTSDIGIISSLADFSSGLTYKSETRNIIDETYSMKSGKASTYYNKANELVLTFTKKDAEFILYFRAYDDGFAFRYTLKKEDGSTGELIISKENSSFAVPEDSTVIGTKPVESAGKGTYSYESTYSSKSINSLKDVQSMPLTYHTPDDLWTVISEANLYDDLYCGSFVTPSNGKLVLSFATAQNSDVHTTYPFTSPWRLAISGSLGELVESTMVENLNDPCIYDDTSWIEPGLTGWTWIAFGQKTEQQHNYSKIKEYLDFAEEIGCKYYILDEGWQPLAGSDNRYGTKYGGYYDWFDELVEYADSKGIKLFAWILADDLNTPLKREVLSEFKEKGIAGIKVDFFDSEATDRIALYKDVYEACAENKLLVNVHGTNKPTGEIRKYPNILNREAIRGEEYFGSMKAEQFTLTLFNRGVVGPTDITPRIIPNTAYYLSSLTSDITTSYQAALYIMFESGMACLADTVENYRKSPAYSLLKDFPSYWDETHFIAGNPGRYATLARRNGDVWYAASINGGTAMNAVFPLDFLSDGDYEAYIYRDGSGQNSMVAETKTVNKNMTLTIAMAKNGGCSIKFVPLGNNIEDNTLPEYSITLKDNYDIEIKSDAEKLINNINKVYFSVFSNSSPDNKAILELDFSIKDEHTIAVLYEAYKYLGLKKGTVDIGIAINEGIFTFERADLIKQLSLPEDSEEIAFNISQNENDDIVIKTNDTYDLSKVHYVSIYEKADVNNAIVFDKNNGEFLIQNNMLVISHDSLNSKGIENNKEYFLKMTDINHNKLFVSYSRDLTFIINDSFDEMAYWNKTDTNQVSLILPEGVTVIKSDYFKNAVKLETITLPSTLTSIDDYTFSNCSNLNKIIIPKEAAELVLKDLNSNSFVTYKMNDLSLTDRHNQYPTGMNVYTVSKQNDGTYIATRHKAFDDILKYAGASIRTTGNKGIRIITSIPTATKNKLVNETYDGYKVMEYGTLMCWASALRVNEEPTLKRDKDGIFIATHGSKGRAYSRTNSIYTFYKEANGITQYTNTLVGDYTNDQCASDVAMRSYIILRPAGETNSENDVVIYGGTLYRSISFVAYQNRNAFNPDTNAYEYIWSLIRAGYGNQYDGEYKGA